MAVQVTSLASGAVPQNTTAIYTSTSITTIVKGIRLVNKDSVARTCNLYIRRPNSMDDPSTDRRLSAKDMTIPPGGLAIDDQEITMSTGGIIKADTSGVASVNIDFVMFGIQR